MSVVAPKLLLFGSYKTKSMWITLALAVSHTQWHNSQDRWHDTQLILETATTWTEKWSICILVAAWLHTQSHHFSIRFRFFPGNFNELTHLKRQGQDSSRTHSNHRNGKWQYAATSPIIPQITTKHYIAETWNWNRCPRNILRSKQSLLVHRWSCFSSWPQHQV